jgi:hypothetical protein
MRSRMDEEAGEAVASDGVGERGAGEGRHASAAVWPRCWRAAIMRVQRRWWPVYMWGGSGWRKPGWGFKMLRILGVGDCVSLLGGGATAV